MSETAQAYPLPEELPLFPLNGVLLLPRGDLPLNVFEPRYLAMVDAALAGERTIGIVQPAADGTAGLSAPDGTNLYGIGCAGRIRAFEETRDGRYLIQLHGLCRFNLSAELEGRDGYRRARVNYAPFRADLEPAPERSIERERLMTGLNAYFELRNISADWEGLTEAPDEYLVNTLSMVCPFDPAEKQVLLESPDLAQRCKLLIGIIEAALREGDDAPGGKTLN